MVEFDHVEPIEWGGDASERLEERLAALRRQMEEVRAMGVMITLPGRAELPLESEPVVEREQLPVADSDAREEPLVTAQSGALAEPEKVVLEIDLEAQPVVPEVAPQLVLREPEPERPVPTAPVKPKVGAVGRVVGAAAKPQPMKAVARSVARPASTSKGSTPSDAPRLQMRKVQ